MSSNTHTNILKSAGIIMICTALFKLFGFIKDILLTYYFGTSGISDAFLISLTIPGTLFEFVGTGLTACFIPIYFMILEQNGEKKAYSFTDKITTLILAFATVIVIAVWTDTPLFVRIFASGFKDSTLNLACEFTRISVLSLYFSSILFVYSSYLQANKIFYPSAITATVQSFLVLIAIYIGAKYNILLMSILFSLSIGCRLIYLYPCVRKTGYKPKLDFHWKDKNVSKFGLLLLPVAFGSVVNDINVIIDRTLASQIAIGAISALTYGNSMIQLANGGLIQPIATVFFPYITEHISKGNHDKAIKMLNNTLSLALFIFVPLSIYFSLYSKAIIHFVFERGAFQEEALNLTSTAFYFYSFGLCFIAIREFLSRFYYAYSDTKTPMINAIIGVILNVIFNLTLSKIMGIGGLALATSLSAAITSLLLIMRAKQKLRIHYSQIVGFKDFSKIIIIGIILYILNKLFIVTFGDATLGLDIITIFSSMIIYLILAFIFRISSMNYIIDWMKLKIKKIA